MKKIKDTPGRILRFVKRPFSIIKTKFISSFYSLENVSFSEKAGSDSTAYPELALKAAIDIKTFSVFRRDHKYTRTLEHVNKKLGQEYLDIIYKNYGLSQEEILNYISPLQKIGRPRLYKLKGIAPRVSSTAIRYLKVALDLRDKFGSDMGDVVEVGPGYGGQGIILEKVCNIKSYTFIDIWQVNLLIRRFIEAANFQSNYLISTLNETNWKDFSWDVGISNYAFSELPRILQGCYIKQIFQKCKHGYMTMNSGEEGCYKGQNCTWVDKNLSKNEMLSKFENSYTTEEKPNSSRYRKNYIFNW